MHIEQSDVQDIFELSMVQKGMLFHYLKEPAANLYNVQLTFSVQGRLHVDAFARAISIVQSKNEALRSVFRWEEVNKPVQIVLHECPPELVFHDLSDRDGEAVLEIVKRYAEADRDRRFDLTGLPLRFQIIKLAETRWILHITHHHLLYDGWSTGIFLKELFSCYAAVSSGTEPIFAIRPAYRDVHRAIKRSQGGGNAQVYWKEYLRDHELASFFPAYANRVGDEKDVQKLTVAVAIDGLDLFTRRNKVTRASVVYSAFGLLMQHYINSPDVVFGTAVSSRDALIAGHGKVMGNFINTLPLRFNFSGKHSLREAVVALNSILIERNGFAGTSYAEIRQFLGLTPVDSLFDAVLVIENYPLDEGLADVCEGMNIQLTNVYEHTDIPVVITIFFQEKLTIEAVYRTAVLDAAAAASLVARFIRVIDFVCTQPDVSCASIPLLTEPERMRLLEEFNATEGEYREGETVVSLFREQVCGKGESVAVVYEGRRISYRELDERSSRLGVYLREALGVGREAVVGLMMERSEWMMVGLLGILKSGAAYVPLDPAYPRERIGYILEDSGAGVVVTDRPGGLEGLGYGGRMVVVGEGQDWEAGEGAELPEEVNGPEDLCYLIYTSGSTGRPKGVMITHGNVVNFFGGMNRRIGVREGDCLLAVTSTSFDISVLELFWTLCQGIAVVIHPSDLSLGDLDRYVEGGFPGVTLLQSTPSFLKAVREGQGSEKLLGSLRALLVGGEAVPAGLIRELRRHTGAEIYNMYGPTETTIWSCVHCFEREVERVSIGEPILNTQVYVLDRELRLVPVGVVGEVFIGGRGLSRGYWKRPELTAGRFIENPYREGEKVYRTGDLGRWREDGRLELVGREDQQVKIRGYRIELGEIEGSILSYGAIREAVVVAREMGEGDRQLVAYVVGEGEVELEGLRRHLGRVLPGYMVPGYYVQLEGMPLTPNGKIDRKALPAPEQEERGEYVVPSGREERLLSEVWSKVLGVGHVGATDNFFGVGGDSIKSIQISSRARRAGYELTVRDIFQYPTVREQAARMRRLTVEEGETAGQVEQVVTEEQLRALERQWPVEEVYGLSPMQEGMLFHSLVDRVSDPYFLQIRHRMEGEADPVVIGRTMGALLRRYGILRTIFLHQGYERPVQVVLREREADVRYIDVREQCGREGREAVVEGYRRRDREEGFGLERSVLLRLTILRTGEKESEFIWSYHHIIMDGWCIGIIIEEFRRLYEGYRRGQEVVMEEAGKYSRYIGWLERRDREAAVGYWKDYLKGFGEATGLPRQTGQEGGGERSREEWVIGREQSRGLQRLCRRYGVTLNTVLETGWGLLLSRYNGVRDVVFGSVVSGRPAELPGIEEMIGLFINTVPVRIRYEGGERIGELLQTVQREALESEPYHYSALSEIQGLSEPGRGLLDHILIVENVPMAAGEGRLGGEGGWFSAMQVFQRTNYDLSITIRPGKEIGIRMDYNGQAYGRELIGRVREHWMRLLEQLAEDGGRTVRELEVVTAGERMRLLEEFNATEGEYREGETVVSLFREQVCGKGESVAVVYEGRRISYRELDERSSRLGVYLREALGVGREAVVGLMMERSEWMMVGLLGILKSGAAYVPLDPAYPRERIGYILEDSGAGVVVTDRSGVLEGLGYGGRMVVVGEGQDWEAGEGAELPEEVNGPQDLCYLIYTSGSTGRPKGVMITHGNVVNFFGGMNRRIGVREGDCLLAVTSTSFDISVLELFWTLCQGIAVVIHPSDLSLGDLDRYTGEDRSMDMSLFFFSSYDNREPDKYELLLESVRYADRHGFKAVWTPERHFHEFGGLYPNPAVISSALAMITERIAIRSGSVVSPLHNAVRIAEEWSVVDNLSKGRVGISFASGWNPNDFVLMPGAYRERQQRMYEQIEVVRKLWKGESIRQENGSGQEVEVRVFPAPVQRELPVWVTSGGSDETFRKAGEIGANVLTHLLGQELEELARKISIYREARWAHGHRQEGGRVAIMLHTYIGEDIQEVEEVVEQPFIEYLKSSIGLSRVVFEEAGLKEEELPEEVRRRMLKNAFRRYYETSSLIGTRSSCGKMIERLKGIGVDEVACLIDFGVERQKVLEGLKLLGGLRELYAKKEGIFPGVTLLQSTPSFLKAVREGQGSEKLLGSLRALLVGGEAVPAGLIRELRRHTGAEIYNMYGPTETTIWSCVHCFEREVERVSIGEPILNTQVYVLDRELRLVPVGVVGEVFIGGRGLSRGYWKRPELTAGRFIENPYREGEKVYRTGDLGRWREDGRLELVGREDQQVKIRGYRIELGEIEGSILSYGAIREAVVVAREMGEGDRQLVAYVVGEGEVELEGLRRHLGRVLPGYMVPGYYVQLEGMPLTPNGKIDRKALPAPGFKGPDHRTEPLDKTEEKIAEIWSEVLYIDKSAIGAQSDFFKLGGNSLNAVTSVNRIEKAFGRRISLKAFLGIPTIKGIAAHLDAISAEGIETAENSDLQEFIF